MQASVANNKTPLWLNANKYGLSSLDKTNGYIRGTVVRPLQADSARRWAVGYCLDLAAPLNYTSNVVVQQAYVEARWLHGVLTAGAKQYPMELKNPTLSAQCRRCAWLCPSIGNCLLVEGGCILRDTWLTE